ncbi:MAG: DUF1080 domain-containing protein [Tepidisphaeraceae bacterium]
MRRVAAVLIAAACASFGRAAPPDADHRTPGLRLDVYDVGLLPRLQNLAPGQAPNVSKIVTSLDLKSTKDFELKDEFLADLRGWLTVDVPGNYEFELRSDDGSEFLLNGRTIVNNDGRHGAGVVRTNFLQLDRGEYPIELRMFDRTGDQQLTLRWKLPGTDEFIVVPGSNLLTRSDSLSNTTSGRKSILPILTDVRPGDGAALTDVHPSLTLVNSPTDPLTETTSIQFAAGPFKRQSIVTAAGELLRVGNESVTGLTESGETITVDNGFTFRFSAAPAQNAQRAGFSDDGQSLIIGSAQYRMSDATAFEPLTMHVRPNGFDIDFTEPLATDADLEPTHYVIKQSRYQFSGNGRRTKVEEQTLQVRSVQASPDRKRLTLEIDGLQNGRVVALRLPWTLRSEAGHNLWTTEAWYTLNRLPRKSDPNALSITSSNPPTQNQLTAEEETAGWRLLFDGKSTKGWRGYRSDSTPAGWDVFTGTLVRLKDGGDLVSVDSFGDFELSIDWKLEESGNSGVMFRCDESTDVPWQSAIEMQCLDNFRHPDGRNPLTSSGAAYALYAPGHDDSFGANRWNTSTIVARGTHVTLKLNGITTADFDTASNDFKQRLKQSKFAGYAGFAQRGAVTSFFRTTRAG